MIVQVKKTGVAANLPMMSDYRILTSLDKLHKNYVKTTKHMDRMTEEEEEVATEELEKTFIIVKKGWREVVASDDILTREEKEAKVNVLEDYLEDGGTRWLMHFNHLNKILFPGVFLCYLKTRRSGRRGSAVRKWWRRWSGRGRWRGTGTGGGGAWSKAG